MVYTWSAYPSFVVVVQTYTLFGFHLFLFCVVLIMVLVGGDPSGPVFKDTVLPDLRKKSVTNSVYVGQSRTG